MNDVLNAIRLIRSENVGPRTYFGLIKRFGSPAKALAALPEIAEKHKRKIIICDLAAAEKEIATAERLGIKILLHSDEAYPEILANTYDAPPVLFYLGDVALLGKRSVGVVGTRNASANGCAITRKLSAELGQAGVVVVSGLARGIDAEAHKASIGTGTIAVVAGGLEEVYPPENEKLFHKIAESGLILSESPVGVRPLARHFPQRNRIIAGISQGVLVVEAAKKSGSMITAEFALREGREVFAIPGSPLDPRCSGTNHLIKTGAVLVESAEDILNNLHAPKNTPRLFEDEIEFLSDDVIEVLSEEEVQSLREQVIAKLSSSPVAVDEIIQQAGVPAALISEILLELELAGKISRQYGNKVSLGA